MKKQYIEPEVQLKTLAEDVMAASSMNTYGDEKGVFDDFI